MSQFIAGFLKCCQDNGLSFDEAKAGLQKAAAAFPEVSRELGQTELSAEKYGSFAPTAAETAAHEASLARGRDPADRARRRAILDSVSKRRAPPAAAPSAAAPAAAAAPAPPTAAPPPSASSAAAGATPWWDKAIMRHEPSPRPPAAPAAAPTPATPTASLSGGAMGVANAAAAAATAQKSLSGLMGGRAPSAAAPAAPPAAPPAAAPPTAAPPTATRAPSAVAVPAQPTPTLPTRRSPTNFVPKGVGIAQQPGPNARPASMQPAAPPRPQQGPLDPTDPMQDRGSQHPYTAHTEMLTNQAMDGGLLEDAYSYGFGTQLPTLAGRTPNPAPASAPAPAVAGGAPPQATPNPGPGNGSMYAKAVRSAPRAAAAPPPPQAHGPAARVGGPQGGGGVPGRPLSGFAGGMGAGGGGMGAAGRLGGGPTAPSAGLSGGASPTTGGMNLAGGGMGKAGRLLRAIHDAEFEKTANFWGALASGARGGMGALKGLAPRASGWASKLRGAAPAAATGLGAAPKPASAGAAAGQNVFSKMWGGVTGRGGSTVNGPGGPNSFTMGNAPGAVPRPGTAYTATQPGFASRAWQGVKNTFGGGKPPGPVDPGAARWQSMSPLPAPPGLGQRAMQGAKDFGQGVVQRGQGLWGRAAPAMGTARGQIALGAGLGGANAAYQGESIGEGAFGGAMAGGMSHAFSGFGAAPGLATAMTGMQGGGLQLGASGLRDAYDGARSMLPGGGPGAIDHGFGAAQSQDDLANAWMGANQQLNEQGSRWGQDWASQVGQNRKGVYDAFRSRANELGMDPNDVQGMIGNAAPQVQGKLSDVMSVHQQITADPEMASAFQSRLDGMGQQLAQAAAQGQPIQPQQLEEFAIGQAALTAAQQGKDPGQLAEEAKQLVAKLSGDGKIDMNDVRALTQSASGKEALNAFAEQTNPGSAGELFSAFGQFVQQSPEKAIAMMIGIPMALWGASQVMSGEGGMMPILLSVLGIGAGVYGSGALDQGGGGLMDFISGGMAGSGAPVNAEGVGAGPVAGAATAGGPPPGMMDQVRSKLPWGMRMMATDAKLSQAYQMYQQNPQQAAQQLTQTVGPEAAQQILGVLQGTQQPIGPPPGVAAAGV